MRFRVRRLLGASALSLVFGLAIGGCSGDQTDEEGLEVSDDQAADGDAAGDNNAAAGDESAGGGNAAADENAAGDGGAGGETADAGTGNATENDLQEIIQEMNGQQGEAGAAAPSGDTANAQALQQDVAAQQPAPANNAAPAAAPAAAPQAAAAQQPQSTALPFQPGGTPAAPGLPEIGSKMAYVVEKGDTLAKISQKIYGSPSRWQEMANLSSISNPSRIFPGDLVYYTLDESAVAFAKAYDTVQRSEEQVKPGDTLATIAQRVYGTTTAWRSIWRHNDKIDNPDVVTPGTTVFYVPKGALKAAVIKAKAELVKLANKTNTTVKKMANSDNKNTKGLTFSQVATSKTIELVFNQVSYDFVAEGDSV